MSKSSDRVNSVVFLDDPDFLIVDKLKKSTTTKAGIDNLIHLLTLLDRDVEENPNYRQYFESHCEELKRILGELLCERIIGIQRSSASFSKDDCMHILVQSEAYAKRIALENHENLMVQMAEIEPL